MPHLIKQHEQSWQLENYDAINWQAADSWDQKSPLLLANDIEPSQDYARASIIGIEFPAFNDGRGLSLAVLLRTRIGFEGELRALGQVHEDILHYMVRCGFTSVELPDERDPDLALQLLAPYSANYQGSAVDPQPAFLRSNRG